jgi:hypothetical protein
MSDMPPTTELPLWAGLPPVEPMVKRQRIRPATAALVLAYLVLLALAVLAGISLAWRA